MGSDTGTNAWNKNVKFWELGNGYGEKTLRVKTHFQLPEFS